jgi:quercetin dioxygenase-like cupin family protein
MASSLHAGASRRRARDGRPACRRNPHLKEIDMALPHAQSGDVIDVRPLGAKLAQATSTALFKSEQLEVMRLILPAGKKLLNHHVPGAITMHCLEGAVEVRALQRTTPLHAGEMMYLNGGEPHELLAQQDASLLVTVALKP